jgi:glucoamylase
MKAEQVNPFTSEPLSVSPLTWSHAQYVLAVGHYLRKYRELPQT